MNPKKSIPRTLESCKCLCCTDCAYYNENVSWTDCKQRNKLIKEHYYKEGRLGI